MISFIVPKHYQSPYVCKNPEYKYCLVGRKDLTKRQKREIAMSRIAERYPAGSKVGVVYFSDTLNVNAHTPVGWAIYSVDNKGNLVVYNTYGRGHLKPPQNLLKKRMRVYRVAGAKDTAAVVRSNKNALNDVVKSIKAAMRWVSSYAKKAEGWGAGYLLSDTTSEMRRLERELSNVSRHEILRPFHTPMLSAYLVCGSSKGFRAVRWLE